MNELVFEDFEFESFNDGLKVWFYKNYYFIIERADLLNIAVFEVRDKRLFFDCPLKVAEKKFSVLLSKGLRRLKNRLRDKETVFIDEELGLPLIGCNEFGLIDRGTNIIEVKPVTGCNLGCVFCSISEGPNNKKDLLVELDYLVKEFRSLASIKKQPIEANIGPQGEPLLYPKIVELVRELKHTDNVDVVSINTNGLLLSEQLINDLFEAGLSRINLSLHSLNVEKASALAGSFYNVDHVRKMIRFCEGKIDVMLTPLYIPVHNEDLEDLFLFAKTIKNKNSPLLGVQNYLNYKQGRNIVQQAEWSEFYDFLKKKEQVLGVSLMLEESDFKIVYDETLVKPFKKGDLVKVEIVCPARNKNEFYARAEGRCLTVISPKKQGFVNVKILRDKHNIFLAT